MKVLFILPFTGTAFHCNSLKESTTGSDCYLIIIGVCTETEATQEGREGRWKFEEANWGFLKHQVKGNGKMLILANK